MKAKEKSESSSAAPRSKWNIWGMSRMGPSVRQGFFSNLYYPLKNMRESKRLLVAANLDLTQLQWGAYQQILAPDRDDWDAAVFDAWQDSVTKVRTSLGRQASTARRGASKCDDLDAAVSTCFSADPPIPMIIMIDAKKLTEANPDQHDVLLNWIPDSHGNPVLLALTMVCPYGS